MYSDLDQVRADIERRLSEGAGDRRAAMHTPVVATADADARVMVLRHFDAGTQTLRFHTDARSPKVAQVEGDPRIAVLFYDREAKVQIRCRGTGRIEKDGPQANAAWAESTNFAKRCYLGAGPGEVFAEPASGLPEEFEGVEPEDEQLIPARENFAILLVEIEEVDWFSLDHRGHRRALFSGGEGRWIAP